MKIIVTCGPSYEPVDQARRLTNFSTGRLGIELANAFTAQGWEVHCLKGELATCANPLQARHQQTFSTNEDLAEKLRALAGEASFDAVFHAAALCDFKVEKVVRADGQAIESPKFSTREGPLSLVLGPTLKVLPQLRGWFPDARIAGWKYELAGTPADAFGQAWQQLRACHTDACVLNGAAYGRGFALCMPGENVQKCADAGTLAQALIDWLQAGTRALPA